ncbi:hypothetical protein SAMN06264364_1343 [Quadrisphaera granulorum]|uniref:Potassium transporter Trk n=1 Tax=Quadrisphaera granulorum TaxID=317664 RepID=A0A315ZRT4_9ACTN|nr:hypothetical protein BXY45_1343 [Quadrisphaera granulorum]SZE98600.1 hypothetical protein SAMN06264364_1343 [Quadrisphaera granulorum]
MSEPSSQHPDGPEAPPPPRALRRVRVTRSPRYGVFLLGGAVLGALVAVVLTFSQPESEYGYSATLGYLVVALGAFGALVGGLAAVVAGAVLDRQDRRRSQRRD